MEAIAAAIDARDDGRIAPSSLANALRLRVGIDDVAPFIRFDPKNYVRSLVTRRDRWELRLLCWKPGQSTSVHGHGASACAFKVLRGSATEAILGDRDRVWTPGAVVEESAATLIHQVSNASSDALLTLHAYSPPLPVDAPSPREGHDVVIAGGGFSGVALAYHLLKRGGPDLRITIVERGPWLGRGVAYSVDSSTFRLNVPASRMSIDPEIPDDFVRWSGVRDRPHSFLERATFGAYVVDRLAAALQSASAKLRVVRADATSCDEDGVRTSNGDLLPAAAVVVATGISPRIAQSGLPADARIVDAWDECALAALPSNGRILILGAGLSALDVVALLQRREYRGTLTILSRHGLLPRPHLEPYAHATPLSANAVADAPRNLRGLVRWIRDVVDDAERSGRTWQQGIDALRPHLSTLWRNLPPQDRERFVHTVRPYWEVLRHRAPPGTLDHVESLRASGRLDILAGRIVACEANASSLDVAIQLRGGATRTERYDTIVRCIGPALQQSELETPLLGSLRARGIAVVDDSGLGVVTSDDGAFVGRDGRPSDRYFALGAHRRASNWETTSVPDISVHALALARRLTS